jgi:hypothetical protein
MITNKNGSVNLQSALNHLVNMGVRDPNILMEYAQKPPSWLGSNAGLLVNMAANMVGDQKQRAQAAQQQGQGQQPTVMEQGIAKLAPQQPQMMAQAPQMPPQAPPQMMPQAPVQMAQGGLAELDVGDMYSENSFASGGIVAFDEGGEVKHYDGTDGSYVEGVDYPDYTVEEEEPTSPFARFADYLDISKHIRNTDFGKRAERRKQLDEEIQKTVPTLIGGERGMFDKETKSQQKEYEIKRKALQEEKKKYPFFAPTTITTPTIDVTADQKKKVLDDIDKQRKALDGKDTSLNGLKKANDDYLNTLRQTNADQISSYDQAMQKVMDLAKNDPYRKQLRDEYDKEKSGAFYDVLGDIGASLVGAKKGQEGQALQQGLTAATSRVKDLRKQKRDLMLAEQKADRDYQMLGAKYGFDSEQAKAALAAKERMAEKENKVKLEYGSLISGGREGKLDVERKKAASKDFLAWQKDNVGVVMLANTPLNGDKKHDAKITAAQKTIMDKQNYYNNYYSLNSFGAGAGTKVVDFNDLNKE